MIIRNRNSTSSTVCNGPQKILHQDRMKTGFCSASFQLASIKSVALVFEQEVNLKLFSIECRKKGVIILLIMAYRLWSFETGGTKLERFFS